MSETINTLNHSGSGDNFVGDKYVNINSSTPENFTSLVFEVKQQTLERKFEQARVAIQTLKKIHNLNAEAEGLITSLESYLDIREHKKLDDRNKLVRLLQATTDNLTKDIINTALIYLDFELYGSESAQCIFHKNKHQGPFSQELFLELFANEEQLRTFISENSFPNISEYISLMRGAERINSTSLMHEIANKLNNEYEGSFLSKKYLLIAKIASFNETVSPDEHYWLSSAETKVEITNISSDLAILIDFSEGKDDKLFEIADSILKYTLGETSILFDTLWKHIKEFDKISPKSASRIRNEKEKHHLSTLNDDSDIEKLERLKTDASFKKEFLDKLSKATELTENDFFIAMQSSETLEALKKWSKKGGLIKSNEQFINDFLNLELQIISSEKSQTTSLDLEKVLDTYINKHFSEINKINPFRINNLCDTLNHLGLPNYTVQLLQSLINRKVSLWPSPIVKTYLIGLLNSSKLKSLRETLNLIPKELYDAESFKIESILEYLSGNSKKAFLAITQSLTEAPNDLVSWAHLFAIVNNSKATFELDEWIEKIPEHFFNEYSEIALNILIEVAKHSGFKKVEGTLLNWFIASPHELAIPITQVFLNDLVAQTEIVNLSPEVNGIVGVKYYNNKELVTKLLIDDRQSANNEYCIKRSSALGKTLLKLRPGETTSFKFKNLTLKDFEPPLLSANHISLHLRDANNDGSDCFYAFDFPEDPDEMMKELTNVLEQLQEPKERYDSIGSFIIRGKISQHSDPVKGALEQLVDYADKIPPLNSIGETSSTKVLLDVYAICYLSITGLWKALDNADIDFSITKATKAILSGFIKQKAAMQASAIDGELFFQSEEQVHQRLSLIKEAFQTIINSTSTIELKDFDVPDKFYKIKDVMDASVFSTICTSSETGIPWLCIDSNFSPLGEELNFYVVNSIELLNKLGQQLEIQDKVPGLYLNAHKSLPYLLTYNEIIELAHSNDHELIHLLSLLLIKHTNPFKDLNDALNFFKNITGMVLVNAKGMFHEHPSVIDDSQRVFNGCCTSILKSSPEIEAEEKLVAFLKELLIVTKILPGSAQIISALSTNFAVGHFLNIDRINAFLNKANEGQN